MHLLVTTLHWIYMYTMKFDARLKRATSSMTGTTEKNNVMQVSEPLLSQNSTVSASNTNSSTSDTTLFKDEGVPNADANGTASDTMLSKDEGILNVDSSIGTVTPNADKDQPNEGEDGAGVASSITTKPVYAPRSQKRCKSGYVPNGNGRCRRASRPWLTRLLP